MAETGSSRGRSVDRLGELERERASLQGQVATLKETLRLMLVASKAMNEVAGHLLDAFPSTVPND